MLFFSNLKVILSLGMVLLLDIVLHFQHMVSSYFQEEDIVLCNGCISEEIEKI